ncbi:MAG: hypothetical protein ABS910_16115, partial [Arthrobacter sp.]
MFESITATTNGPRADGGNALGVIEDDGNAWDLLGRFEVFNDHTCPEWNQHEWDQLELNQLALNQAGPDSRPRVESLSRGAASPVMVSVETVRSFSAALADARILETTDPQLIDLMRVLEELKSAAAAVQA